MRNALFYMNDVLGPNRSKIVRKRSLLDLIDSYNKQTDSHIKMPLLKMPLNRQSDSKHWLRSTQKVKDKFNSFSGSFVGRRTHNSKRVDCLIWLEFTFISMFLSFAHVDHNDVYQIILLIYKHFTLAIYFSLTKPIFAIRLQLLRQFKIVQTMKFLLLLISINQNCNNERKNCLFKIRMKSGNEPNM